VLFALQVSIVCTVFGFGLKTQPADLLDFFRRPTWLLRALVAVFVIMPLVAILLVRIFEFERVVEIALIALAISPAPPLLPQRQERVGGVTSYVVGLLAVLSLLAIVMVPLSLEILERVSGRSLGMAPGTIARIVFWRSLLPLAAGMFVLVCLPRLVPTIYKIVALLASVLLLAAASVLIAGSAPAVWALVGDGTILAMVLFLVIGLAVGHAVAGRDPHFSGALALATAYRHPAMAFAIAATNFPEERFAGAILLYVIVSVVIGIPYVAWQRRRLQGKDSVWTPMS
jgi:BASS family bile acid:Na+ symporter